MLRYTGLVCCCLVAFALACPAAAETLEEVEQKLTDAQAKIKSFTARTAKANEGEMGPGTHMRSEAEGTIEMMHKDGKILLRSEEKGIMISTRDGKESRTEHGALLIADGKYLWLISSQGGRTMPCKFKSDPAMTGDVRATFDSLKKTLTLKLLPNEKFDGQDCYVIEATPSKPNPGPVKRQVLYFQKSTGILTKLVKYGVNDKLIGTDTTTGVKVNVAISPERFRYEPAEDVQVMDMTGAPQSMPMKP